MNTILSAFALPTAKTESIYFIAFEELKTLGMHIPSVIIDFEIEPKNAIFRSFEDINIFLATFTLSSAFGENYKP